MGKGGVIFIDAIGNRQTLMMSLRVSPPLPPNSPPLALPCTPSKAFAWYV